VPLAIITVGVQVGNKILESESSDSSSQSVSLGEFIDSVKSNQSISMIGTLFTTTLGVNDNKCSFKQSPCTRSCHVGYIFLYLPMALFYINNLPIQTFDTQQEGTCSAMWPDNFPCELSIPFFDIHWSNRQSLCNWNTC
jgi:hypothetical protein